MKSSQTQYVRPPGQPITDGSPKTSSTDDVHSVAAVLETDAAVATVDAIAMTILATALER